MLFNPTFRLSVIGTEMLNQPPKPRGMVVLLGMGQLMQDDVIPDGIRHLYQPPVERDGSPTRTRAPAGSLIADGDAIDRQGVLSSQLQRPCRQLAGSQLAEMALNDGTKIVGVANAQGLVAKLYEMPVLIEADDELDFPAPVQNVGSVLPGGGMGGIFVVFLELFEDPVGIAFRESPGLFDRANPRNGCADGVVRLYADDVVPCSAIADELDGDRLGIDPQGMLDRSGVRTRGEKEVQLHGMSKSGLIVVGNRWVYGKG
jgi:hypothetical protein